MFFNTRDQLGGCSVDGFQAGPKFLQFLALGPGGDIAEAVFGGFNAKILADRIGNAFCFHFLGVAILLGGSKKRFVIVSQFGHVVIVMEPGMGDLMDSSADSLYFAHTGLDSDALVG